MRTSTWLEGVSKTLTTGLLLLAIMGLGSGPCWAEEALRVFITEIIADTSEILADGEIESITQRYVGREVAIADLDEMVEEINALYRQRKFPTAKAILPAQKVEDGVVRIRLVEGRIGRVLVEGNASSKASYFTRRVRLTPGDLVRLDDITSEVVRFNRVHDDQVAVQLRPGEEFGTTDCILIVQEAPNQLIGFIDNAGRDETGLVRFGTTVLFTHALGYGDSFTVSAVLADGTRVGSASYSIPLGVRGTRLSIGYDGSEVDVQSSGFGDIEIKSSSSDLHMELSFPLIVSKNVIAWGPVQFHHKRLDSTFSGVSLVGSVVRTVGAGFKVQWESPGLVWHSECDYQAGEVELGGEHSDKESSAFYKGGSSFAWQKAIGGKYSLTIKGAMQITKEQLPASERFSVGGVSTVRGYPEGALIGDQGYFTSVELEVPIGSRLVGSLFLDHGGAFAASGSSAVMESGHLTGMGVGLSARILPNLSCKVAYGMSRERSPRIHASLQTSF